MANKRISELNSRTPATTDLMLVGDPTTGYSYKCTIAQAIGLGVTSFNGRTGAVSPAEGDYSLNLLSDVTITSPTNGQVLTYNGTAWVNGSLSGYVPYTGATANVTLGEYGLKAGWLGFDLTPTGTPTDAGTMSWNDADGTMDLILKGGNVILQVGQEEVIRVVNKTGSNLTEAAYKVVRVRTAAEGGAQGQRLAVVLAQANTKANHTGVLGLVTEDISNNQEGFITTFGMVRNINTTGSLQGETWGDGSTLWLSDTVAGGLTNIEPTTHPVRIGYVVYAHANNGKIFVAVQEGVDELNELHDVTITSPTNGQALTYNSTLSRWENTTISTDNIYTANGTLTGNRTVTIGSNTLTFTANYNGASALRIQQQTNGTSAIARLDFLNSANENLALGKYSPTTSTYKIFAANDGFIYTSTGDIALLSDAATSKIKFAAGGSSAAQMIIQSNGNIGINTTTDAGYKLDVNGTARVLGTANNAALTVSVGGSSSNIVLGGHNVNSDFTRIQIGNNFSLNRNGGDVSTMVSTLGLSIITEFVNFVNAGNSPGAIRFIGNFGLGTPSIGIFNSADADLLFGNANATYTYKQNTLARNVLWYQSDTSTSPTKVASAIMALQSTTKGFLPPRMTSTQRNAITSPAEGLIVYDTTAQKLYVYTTGWEEITSTLP